MMSTGRTGLIKDDFPALAQTVNGRPVCYLDSAASAQKPRAVIDAMNAVMEQHYANVHRGVYAFSTRTTIALEDARGKVARFVGAASAREIVFTRNATEAINLVAASYGGGLVAGDEILLTELEHHANIVPWYLVAQKTGARLRVVPILQDGSLDMGAFEKLLSKKTKLVAVTQMSNVLGTVTPVQKIVDMAKAAGATTLIDGSQGIVHLGADVQRLGCDFYVFTGHKLYGPTGIGVLYGRAEVLDPMPPYQGGGEMIENVTFDNITFREPPTRFEAGTPAIVEAIGLGAAIDYVSNLSIPVEAGIHLTAMDPGFPPSPEASADLALSPCVALAKQGRRGGILEQEAFLLSEAEKALSGMKGLKIYSRAPERAAILSFTMEKAHPHDIAMIFDQMGICVRAGHHCAQPLMKALGVPATVRASFAAYNTTEDVERLIEGVEKVGKIFA